MRSGELDLEEEIRKVTEGVDTALKLDDDKEPAQKLAEEPEAVGFPLRQDSGSDTEDAQKSIPKGVVSRMAKAIQGQDQEIGTDIKDDRGREGRTVNGSEGAPKDAVDFRIEAKKKIQLAAQGAATPLDEVAIIFDPKAPVAEKKVEDPKTEGLLTGVSRYEGSSDPDVGGDPTPSNNKQETVASKETSSSRTQLHSTSTATQDVPSTEKKEATPPSKETGDKASSDDAKL